MADAPPLSIEINYDAERELFGDESEAPDARHVRVEIKNRKIKPGTMKFVAPEDQPKAVIPIQVRPDTEVCTDGVIEFRAELNLDGLTKRWGDIESAAKHAHPFVITAQVESHRSTPQHAKRQAKLTINLNSIRWKWTPLVRDDKGVVSEDGPTQENTTIEVKIDGTDRHGFRLELERLVWVEDDGLDHEEADFVHYLSPDHKCDFKVLCPKQIPWEIPEGENQRQVTTEWWAQALPAGHEILARLPVETTIRVRAYQANSIRKHVSGGAPKREPPDAPMLATREIPLQLGVRKWRVKLIKPEPSEPPVELEGSRPWENGIDVEVSILDDANPDEIEYFRNREFEWKLKPGPNGKYCGDVKDAQGESKTSGIGTTDEEGTFQFKFCPTRENSLFLAAKEGTRYYAEFEVRQKGGGPDKPGPRIPSIEKPNDENAPSFRLEWAPMYDLGAFKLPFFIKPGASLDLEAEPDEETVVPVPLTLKEDQKRPYRMMFRTGGTITLKPVVPWASGDNTKVEVALRHYRLIVGDNSRQGDEKRQILVVDLPPESAEWPRQVAVPAPPGQSGDGSLVLTTETPLHPDIARYLDRVRDEAAEVESKLCVCEGLTGTARNLGRDADRDFRKLALDFGETAIKFFAETDQKPLVEKRKPIKFTLSAMPMYVRSHIPTWTRLGAAVNFHRQSFKRVEEDMLNFYYDFICWGPIEKMLKSAWNTARNSAYLKWLPEEMPSINWFVKKGSDAIQNALLKGTLQKLFAGALKSKLTEARNRIAGVDQLLRGYKAGRDTAMRALEDVQRRLGSAVRNFSNQSDEVLRQSGRVEEALGRAATVGMNIDDVRAALRRLNRGQYVEPEIIGQVREIREKLLALKQARDQLRTTAAEVEKLIRGEHKRALKQRLMAEAQVRGAEAARKTWTDVEQHLQKGETELAELLRKEAIEADDATKLVDDFRGRVPSAPDSMNALRDEAKEAIDQAFATQQESWNEVAQRVNALRQSPGSSRLDALDDLPAQPLTAPAHGFTGALDVLEREARGATTESREFAARTKDLLDHRVRTAQAIWEAEKASMDEMLSDGVKSGTHYFTEQVRNKLDGAPDPPPFDETWMDTLWNGFRAMVNKVLELLGGALRNLLSGLLTLLGWILRIILFPLNLLLRLTARVGAKLFEVLTTFFHALAGPQGWWKTTALTENALNAGMGALRANASDADKFFDFPYWREESTCQRMIQAAQSWSTATGPTDRNIEQAIEDGLKTGYEDYYPGEVARARRLLFSLCKKVLSRETLETPPCDEDPAPRMVQALSAGDHLEQDIKVYQASTDRQSLAEKGMFAPLWSLMEDMSGWNSRDFDAVFDWMSWIIAWGLRLMALFVAILSWWFPPLLAASFSMLAGAQLISAITAAGRVLVAMCGFYPYSTAYPRDIVALQGAHYALVFPPATERLAATQANELVKGYPK